MSGTPSLSASNKDKVANKFGIQLKPKDTLRRPSTSSIEQTTSTSESSNVTKNKTVNVFRTNNNLNGFLSNTNRSNASEKIDLTKKLPEKLPTSKSTPGLQNTSVNNERSNSLTSNINHSTTKSREPSPCKPSVITKRSSVIPTERAISPVPPLKRPNTFTTAPKTEAQIQHQKDQPLYRRQLSKPLDHTSSTVTAAAAATTTTTTTTTSTSTSSLKK